MESKKFVIRLGGSLISPEPGMIAVDFLRDFKDLILAYQIEGYSFSIICGGGKTCRSYQDAAQRISPEHVTNLEMDWIGIFTNNLNAQVVRVIFPKNITHDSVIIKLEDIKKVEKPIAIIGGEAPGHSSNYDAVMIAHHTNAGSIVNLSNIEHIYDSDPRIKFDAKKYDDVTWDQYLTFIPEEWSSGMSTPFDPVSSRKAKELGLSIAFMKGDNLDNLKNYLDGRPFIGSVIHS